MTYLRRNAELRKAVKALINERLVQRSLEQIQVASGEVFLMAAGALEQALPRVSKRMLILSPFDNSVIQRERLKAIFQFEYQLECYVPAVKRQYGYFCLPLLYRDEFIGRMDCKTHRKDRHLEVKLLYFEKHTFDEELVITAFVDAISKFCYFQKCDSVSLAKAHPKQLSQRLHNALKQLG